MIDMKELSRQAREIDTEKLRKEAEGRAAEQAKKELAARSKAAAVYESIVADMRKNPADTWYGDEDFFDFSVLCHIEAKARADGFSVSTGYCGSQSGGQVHSLTIKVPRNL